MTDSDAARLRDDFLARLDAALREVPFGTAREIHEGIAEELQGLDAQATAERIAALGDPERIAREAQAEAVPAMTVAPSSVVVAPRESPPVTGTMGFAIAASLTLGFGGFLVPFLGWFVGGVLVVLSTLWYRWEKIVAILLPFIGLLVLGGIAWIVSLLGASPEGTANPLLPVFGPWHVLILGVFAVVPLSGLWLLWRLRGRRPSLR